MKRDLIDLEKTEPQIDEDLWGDQHIRSPLTKWQIAIGVVVAVVTLTAFGISAGWL